MKDIQRVTFGFCMYGDCMVGIPISTVKTCLSCWEEGDNHILLLGRVMVGGLGVPGGMRSVTGK